MKSPILSPSDRNEVARLIEEQGLLSAVLYLRRAVGAGLADAVDLARAVASEAGLLRPPHSPTEMSAEILAIGPFRRNLVPFLDYPSDRYKLMPEGMTVLATVVEVYNDTSMHEVAACFGIDPWDFNAHELDASRTDLDALRAVFSKFPDEGDALVETLIALRDAGFRFYFHGPYAQD